MRYDYEAQGGAYKTRMRYHAENVEEEYMSVANFTKEDSKNETIERS